MNEVREFHYRMPGRAGGWRPGSHPSRSLGAGHEFMRHARLFDRPDPRRLDLRASLRSIEGEWLVRADRQRAAISVHAVVDVSASMAFGSRRPKLEVAADFVEALGASAYRVGDAAGMLAFDSRERDDLFVPAMHARGVGNAMAGTLRGARGGAGDVGGLEEALGLLAGQRGLVFLVSDFHWPLDRLAQVLEQLAHAVVVPMLLWDPVEMVPPPRDGFAQLRDAESGALRTLWLRPQLRERWKAAAARHRETLARIFAACAMRPFVIEGAFNAEALSRHFLEMAG